VTDTLVVEFEVAAPVEHAFAIWTERCASWWPADHTLTTSPIAITFEPFAGGRIFEVGPDGAEHPWGEILVWEPPNRAAYQWHLFFDPSEATTVEVTFRQGDANRTLVRIEQSGWERLGDAGPPRRTRTGQAWNALSGRFRAACDHPTDAGLRASRP
jgi:uncharacterized protein YndB with AHSA1/START domain